MNLTANQRTGESLIDTMNRLGVELGIEQERINKLPVSEVKAALIEQMKKTHSQFPQYSKYFNPDIWTLGIAVRNASKSGSKWIVQGDYVLYQERKNVFNVHGKNPEATEAHIFSVRDDTFCIISPRKLKAA